MKNEKGITLVMLAVTIVILIILSSLSINMILGEGGLINVIKQNQRNIEEESIKSKIRLEILDYQSKNDGKIGSDALYEILEKYGEIQYKENEDSNNPENIKSIITYDSQIEIDITDIIEGATIFANSYINTNTLYCWEHDLAYEHYRDEFYAVCDELDITSVYFYFKTENFTTYKDETRRFISELKDRNINVLALNGDPSWTFDSNKIKTKLVDPVVEYNNSVSADERIIGIVIDIEPASAEGWNDNKLGTLTTYVNTQKTIYQEIKNNGLICVECIPTWFDSVSKELLEDLVANACDGISVMNYSRTNMVEIIRNEIGFAKKYNKFIDSITEFQKPNGTTIEDEITFYYDGIEAAQTKYAEVVEEYDYSKLGMSYHYYTPVLELLGIDDETTYDGELYFRDGNYELITGKLATITNTSNRNDKFKRIITSGGYITSGLKYGVTYEVNVDGYKDTKTFMYDTDIGDYKVMEFNFKESSVYTGELYLRDSNNNMITGKSVTVTNSQDSTETYTKTTNSESYIVISKLKYGVTYEITVDGYSSKRTLYVESDDNNYVGKTFYFEESGTYTGEIYFRDGANELITGKTATITNVNDNTETYSLTITSGGYVSLDVKYGVTYQISVEGYEITNTFKNDEDVGSYKVMEFTFSGSTTYTGELYFNDMNGNAITGISATVTNAADSTETYTKTIRTGGFIVIETLKYGATYEVTIEGYSNTNTFKVDSDDNDYIGKEFKFQKNNTYNVVVYLKDSNYDDITSKPQVTVTNTNDATEFYQKTAKSAGYVSLWVKYGETYEVSLNGYTDAKTFTFDSSVGSYKEVDLVFNQ